VHKGLLISGYHSISQASWAEFIVKQVSDIEWSTIALPPRYFSWRMRGNPLSIGQLAPDVLAQPFDILLATSSIDLATVQSIYPSLRNIPSILYFHDNQFAYPESNNPQSVVDWQITAIYSAIRADKLVFNSQFNRDSFLHGVKKLLKKMPDLAPKQLALTLEQKATILPAPIKEQLITKATEQRNKMRIVWNHRWEWDKCPELLEKIVEKLKNHSERIELIITGQQFRTVPDSFKRLQLQSDLISHCQFVEDKTHYQTLLASCDVVLSTAIHEFQGIAVLEAVEAGCVPLLPNRLSYPEIFDHKFLYLGSGSIDKQAISAVDTILSWQEDGIPSAPTVSSFHESKLRPRFIELMASLLPEPQ
jgi:glycosyltransferase involved in cell wall biosynthesis